jgi:hypothetical protein
MPVIAKCLSLKVNQKLILSGINGGAVAGRLFLFDIVSALLITMLKNFLARFTSEVARLDHVGVAKCGGNVWK